MNNFISHRDALDLLGRNDVNFIDGSWYLPGQNRNAQSEFNAKRIPGAVFFDIDLIADQDSELPHMLPTPETFSYVVGAMGVSSENTIIIYDGPGLFSAPRVWWTFKIMGAQNVKILEGGFDSWWMAGNPVETGALTKKKPAIFDANFKQSQVASLSQVVRELGAKDTKIIDARPNERFNGTAQEPREGLRSGHIPGSYSIPANSLVNDGKLASKETLERHFRQLNIGLNTPVITTCGSGVTAAILSLALTETGRHNHKLFDGSWAQWGKPDGPEIASNAG